MEIARTPEQAVANFVRTLDVVEWHKDTFRGWSEREEGRLFGGLVMAQAAIAGARTVPDDMAQHSMHVYFLRPGRPDLPIDYFVERPRDGKTFTSRRILARQGTEAICDTTLSFVRPEEGIGHQEPMPDVPDAESLQDHVWTPPPHIDPATLPMWPFQMRLVQPENWVAGEGEDPTDYSWIRPRSPFPDEPSIHVAALVYQSDGGSFAGIERRYGWEGMSHKASASLDHALWLHRPFTWDDWLLFVTTNPVANAGRPLTFRYMYTRDGTHVATMAQEAIFRRERGS
jgi:acyl-CoA thioesterase-2